MPALAVDQCITSGHGSFPPTTVNASSTNVFCNGKAVVLEGDSIVTHCDPDSCHSGTTIAITSGVYVNGKKACSIGSPVTCGDTIAQGSENVFIG